MDGLCPAGVNGRREGVVMVDIERWWNEVEPVRSARPANGAELVAVLSEVAELAGRWSDVLCGLREPTRRFGGTAAAASFDAACRRAEQAFVELEIAVRDARGAV